jgi:hypothetical protein
MGRLMFTVALSMLASCAAEEPTPQRRCEQVRDRLIELRLANATGVDIQAHREAMKNALGDAVVASCTSNLTVSQQQCVLKARDSAAATVCSTQQPN